MNFEPLKLKCPSCGKLFDVDLYKCPYCDYDASHDKCFMTVELAMLSHAGGEITGDRRGIPNYEPLNFYPEGFDYMEVYNTQCEYAAYLILKNKIEDYTNFGVIWGEDGNAFVREGSGFVFLINNGYLVDLTEKEFRETIEEKFTVRDLKSYLWSYGLNGSSDDKEVLLDILYNNDIQDMEDYLFWAFSISPEGLEFYNNPIFKDYEENHGTFEDFFTFKKLRGL